MEFFKVQMEEVIGEDKKGGAKWETYTDIYEAEDVVDVQHQINENYKGLMVEWKTKSITKVKFRDVYLQPTK